MQAQVIDGVARLGAGVAQEAFQQGVEAAANTVAAGVATRVARAAISAAKSRPANAMMGLSCSLPINRDMYYCREWKAREIAERSARVTDVRRVHFAKEAKVSTNDRMARSSRGSKRNYKRSSSRKRSVKRKKKTKRARSKSAASCTKLAKRVRNVERLAGMSVANLYNRIRTHQVVTAVINNFNVSQFVINTRSNIETQLQSLRFYNKSTELFDTYDGSSTTFSKKVFFKPMQAEISLINNQRRQQHVELWLCKAKKDSNTGPATAWGDIDDVSGESAVVPLSYPTDSVAFRELWDIAKKYEFTIMPGATVTAKGFIPGYTYDNSAADEHPYGYQKRFKSHAWLMRLQGPIVRDASDPVEYGLAASELIVQMKQKYHLQYDGGANFDYYVYNDDVKSDGTPFTGISQGYVNQPQTEAV